MLQREVSGLRSAPVCPNCGGKLMSERGLWTCRQHGSFFAYGPHLLVRAPQKGESAASAPLPWENGDSADAR